MLRDLFNLVFALFCTTGYVLATIFSQWLQKHPGLEHFIFWVAGLIVFVWRIVVHARRLFRLDDDDVLHPDDIP